MARWSFLTIDLLTKFLNSFSIGERAKVRSVFLLFEEYGPMLPAKYLKRLSGTKDLWELRAKDIRIFFFLSGNRGVGVHGIRKRSQKIPKQDIDTAVNRARLVKEKKYENKIY